MNRDRVCRRACALLLGAALVVFGGASSGSATPLPETWDPARFISVDEIVPGMHGYGYTVFKGTTIERFDVEVLGVIRNRAPGRDAIIARFAGGPIDTAGIMQGMSGSPVYFDGRLAGAVAFGWSFMMEPIGGITPIQEMLPLLGKPGGEPQGVTRAGRAPESLEVPAGFLDGATGADAGSIALAPLATPVLVPDLAPGFLEQARAWMEPLGLTPVPGGGDAAAFSGTSPELEPGAALAVPMVRGDLNIAAIGTVTYAEGDGVLGFGHAFRDAGPVALPMGNAVILGVLPNQQISAKFGYALDTLGQLQHDDLVGIAGTLGDAPAMIPLHVRVAAPGLPEARTYEFDVVPDRDILPVMLTVAGAGSVARVTRSGAPFRAEIRLTVTPREERAFESVTYASSPGGAAGPVGQHMMSYLRAVLNNPFGRMALERVDLDVAVTEGLQVAYLEEVRPRFLRVRPGEALPVTVICRRHEGERFAREITLDVPPTAAEGPLMLIVSDATRTQQIEQRRAPMRFRPMNLPQYLDLLDLDFPENRLTFSLLSPQPGMAVHGEELPLLPGSVLTVMGAAQRRDLAQPTQGTVIATATLPFDAVVQGAAIVPVTVDRHAP